MSRYEADVLCVQSFFLRYVQRHMCLKKYCQQALARKVIRGIHEMEGVEAYNGVHLRMERDAMDWAIIMGGRDRYWKLYRSSMAMARFSRDAPLFVASGLLKGSRNINTENGALNSAADTQAVNQMQKLAQEIVNANVRPSFRRLPGRQSECYP